MLMRELFVGRTLRLALGFALAVTAITATAFALVYLQVAHEETNRVGAILLNEARVNAEASQERLRAALAARETSEIRRVDYLALFDAHNVLVLGNIAIFPPVSVDGLPHILDAGAMRKLSVRRSAPTIVVARRRSDGGVLVLGRTLLDAYEVEATLLRTLAWALAPTILLFLGIGILFSRQMGQRLLGVHQAITRIMGRDITSRLPVSPQGDEIDRIAVDVNRMLDEIARLLEQLKHAGDNIAHELRTPLAVARAKLEHALSEDCGGARPRVAAAVEQLDRASKTISALLRIADFENGRHNGHFVETDLRDICIQALEYYGPLAESKGIRMKANAPEPVPIYGDQNLLLEAVFNLADNAIKFTPAGGEVALSAAVVDCRARVEVRDSGPGVAADERSRVFQRFYRASGSENSSGHGLGLSIALAIADLHGMDLRIEDCPAGALFVMASKV